MSATLSRRHRTRRAFTLIELLIVILLLAILMAIAIPAFFSSKQKATDRTAQANLAEAVQAIEAQSTDANSFALFNQADAGNTAAKVTTALTNAEPNLPWTLTSPAVIKGAAPQVGVNAVSDSQLQLIAPGSQGYCWIVDLNLGTTSGTANADKYGYYSGSGAASATSCPWTAGTAVASVTYNATSASFPTHP